MPAKQPTDTTVLAWVVANYRIIVVVLTLVVGATIAYANLRNEVKENCHHIGRVEAQMNTTVEGINDALTVQDTKLDEIDRNVTRLLVLSERENR